MKRIFDDNGELGIVIECSKLSTEFNDESSCAFESFGLKKNIKGVAVGIDGIQAFVNAMMRLDIFLRASDEFKSGLLRWGGGQTDDDLGLPWVLQNRSDLV